MIIPSEDLTRVILVGKGIESPTRQQLLEQSVSMRIELGNLPDAEALSWNVVDGEWVATPALVSYV